MASPLINNLNRLPIGLLMAAWAGYLAWDYYGYVSNADSPLLQKVSQIEGMKKESEGLQKKVKEMQEFSRKLDQKKAELRELAQKLDVMKNGISEDVDVAAFLKATTTEAKKVGLKVVSMKPAAAVNQEFYQEQPFDFQFKGVYVQLLVFLDRMTQLQQIVRVEAFDVKNSTASSSAIVELDGTVQIKTFKYLSSKADEIAKAKVAQVTAVLDVPQAPAAKPVTNPAVGNSVTNPAPGAAVPVQKSHPASAPAADGSGP